MRLLWMLVLATALATGCAVRTRSGSVVVDPKGIDNRPGGGPPTNEKGEFCPPGQKKKGRC
jgi:hypothetical protein